MHLVNQNQIPCRILERSRLDGRGRCLALLCQASIALSCHSPTLNNSARMEERQNQRASTRSFAAWRRVPTSTPMTPPSKLRRGIRAKMLVPTSSAPSSLLRASSRGSSSGAGTPHRLGQRPARGDAGCGAAREARAGQQATVRPVSPDQEGRYGAVAAVRWRRHSWHHANSAPCRCNARLVFGPADTRSRASSHPTA